MRRRHEFLGNCEVFDGMGIPEAQRELASHRKAGTAKKSQPSELVFS